MVAQILGVVFSVWGLIAILLPHYWRGYPSWVDQFLFIGLVVFIVFWLAIIGIGFFNLLIKKSGRRVHREER